MDKDILVKYWIDFLPYVWDDKENIFECRRRYISYDNLKYLKELKNYLEDCPNPSKKFFDILKIISLDDNDYIQKIEDKNLKLKINGNYIDYSSYFNFVNFFSKLMNLSGNVISRDNISNTLLNKVFVLDSERLSSLDYNPDLYKQLQIPKISGRFYRKYSRYEIFEKFSLYRYIIIGTNITNKYRVVFPELLEKCKSLKKSDKSFKPSDFYYRISLGKRKIYTVKPNISKSIIYYINRFGNVCIRLSIEDYNMTILFSKKMSSIFCICDPGLIEYMSNFEVKIKDILLEIFLFKSKNDDYNVKYFYTFTIFEPNNFKSNTLFLNLLKDIEDNYSDEILKYYSIDNYYKNLFLTLASYITTTTVEDDIIRYDWDLWFVEIIILNLDNISSIFYKDLCKNAIYTILNNREIIHYITNLIEYLSVEFRKYGSNFVKDGININEVDIEKVCKLLCKNI